MMYRTFTAQELAELGSRALVLRGVESEARDDHGRWTSGGGGGSTISVRVPPRFYDEIFASEVDTSSDMSSRDHQQFAKEWENATSRKDGSRDVTLTDASARYLADQFEYHADRWKNELGREGASHSRVADRLLKEFGKNFGK